MMCLGNNFAGVGDDHRDEHGIPADRGCDDGQRGDATSTFSMAGGTFVTGTGGAARHPTGVFNVNRRATVTINGDSVVDGGSVSRLEFLPQIADDGAERAAGLQEFVCQ